MNKNEWRTPPELFRKYNSLYQFNIDLAATSENALCKIYLTKKDNSLFTDWDQFRGNNCWLNPPYSGHRELEKWVDKALYECGWVGIHTPDWLRIVMPLPARTGTSWFHELWRIYKNPEPKIRVDIEFLRGRVAFLDENNQPCKSNPENSIVVVVYGDNKL